MLTPRWLRNWVRCNTDLPKMHKSFNRKTRALSSQLNLYIRFLINNFRFFSPSFQSTFHLSLTVLFRYRYLLLYLALGEIYLLYSRCNIVQRYSWFDRYNELGKNIKGLTPSLANYSKLLEFCSSSKSVKPWPHNSLTCYW